MENDIQIQYITSKPGLKQVMIEVLSELKPPATLHDACLYLNISIPTLRRLIKSNELPAFNIGRQVRIRWSDLEAYVQLSKSSTY